MIPIDYLFIVFVYKVSKKYFRYEKLFLKLLI